MHPLRKLVVLATNELLAQGKIDLNGVSDRDNDRDEGHVFAEIAGRPSVLMWADIGFDELRISVWWDYNHERHPQADLEGNQRERFQSSTPLANREEYPKFVGICASGWLERRDGKYLQGKGSDGIFDTYTRRGEGAALKLLKEPSPQGYKAIGKVHM